MKTVYKLEHCILLEYDVDGTEVRDTKTLGFFTSKSVCLDAKEFYLTLDGFKDFPDGFTIKRIRVDVNDYNNVSNHHDNQKVYQLSHEWYDGEYDYITELGCYSSYEKALLSKTLYENDDIFKNHKEGFSIDECTLNRKGWIFGF